MNIIQISEIKDINPKEYCRLISQIYRQLKRVEKTMKQYSLNDSLHFIQLTIKSFKKEIAKE